MTYARTKRPTDWSPLERHKRSQNAEVVYTLVDEGRAVLDALMRVSSNLAPFQKRGDAINGRNRPKILSYLLPWPSVITGSVDAALFLRRASTCCSISRHVSHST